MRPGQIFIYYGEPNHLSLQHGSGIRHGHQEGGHVKTTFWP